VTEFEFNDAIDDILISIEEQLDEIDTDIDYETSSGILSLVMPNASQIIINRQSGNKQLWMAAKSGGFHFVYDDEKKQWLDTRSQLNFIDSLNQCLGQQCDEKISLT
jgi:CyaY protein